MFRKYIPKSSANVSGKMSKKDAGKVGNKLADAAVMIAAGVFIWLALHALAAIRWW